MEYLLRLYVAGTTAKEYRYAVVHQPNGKFPVRVCEKLETGMVGLNQGMVSNPAAPFGGVKHSGFGREGGNYSMEEMTELKWITIQLGQRQFPF